MAMGRYTNKNIDRINNYEAAKNRYESIKPLRGNSEDIRPLGPRRYTHIRIEKHNSLARNGLETIYCVALYRTRLITYYPDDSMRIQNGGWGTPTTQGVFNEVLPRGMYIEGCKTMRLVVQTAEGTRKYLLPEGGLVLTRERIPQNPEREKSYAINRRKNKEVMRQYSNFFAWAKGYLSLRDHVIPVKETDAVYASAYKDYEFVQSLCIHHIFRAEKKVAARAMLLNMIVNKEEENYEDYINAVALFARVWGCFTFNNGQGHRLTLDNLKKCIVKLHLPEVVEVTVLPAGQEAKRSPYAKWMNGWIKDVYTTNNTTTTALTAQTTA